MKSSSRAQQQSWLLLQRHNSLPSWSQLPCLHRSLPALQLLSERYGISDPELIVFDPWSLNGTPEEYKGRRLMQGFLYVRSCKADNEYAHPLDMCPLVDLNLGKVRL